MRRPVKVEDVASVAGCKVDEVKNVVEVFRREDRSFLVPSVAEKKELTATDVLDISHEALIRQWQRFGGQSEQTGEHESVQSWLEIEEQSRRRYRRLAEAAENEKTAGLLRNPELGFLHQWWESFRPTRAWANACVPSSYDLSESLLKRSLALAEIEEREQQADQQARITTAEEFARKMKRRSVGIAIVAVLAIVGSIKAMLASREAARQKISAQFAANESRQAKEDFGFALNLTTRMFSTQLLLVGEIAAAISNRQKGIVIGNFEALNSQTRPIAWTPEIAKTNKSLGYAIENWDPDENASWNDENEPKSDAVRKAVLEYTRAWRHAWELQFTEDQASKLADDLASKFHSSRELIQRALRKPIYDRAIFVTSTIADGSRNQKDLDDFESLYWSELVLVETTELEACMVRFRRSLRGDPEYSNVDLKAIAGEIKNICNNALAPSDPSDRTR